MIQYHDIQTQKEFEYLNNFIHYEYHMNKAKKVALSVGTKVVAFGGVAGAMLFGGASAVQADGVLPSFIQEIIDKLSSGGKIDTGTIGTFVNNRVRMGLTVLFVAVFLVAIAYSALAAIKFISSQGDSGKLEESKGAVKAILMGFAAMIIAIVGLFVILALLGATSTPENGFNLNVE